MFYVDDVSVSTKAEYERALKDKSIIDAIKNKYDLSTEAGIKGAYSEVKNIRFSTKVGDKFDDEIFNLYQNLSKVTSEEKKVKKESKKKKVDSKDTKAFDEENKKEIIKEIKRRNQRRTFFVIGLLIIGFASIGYSVNYYMKANKLQNNVDQYSELKNDKYADILTNVKPVVKKDYEEDVVIPEILDEYVAAYNKNKSLIGWIKIADTNIDYPVMQTKDNEYYLKHNFNQENDANGCIFLDCNCDVILKNDNFILYGHHMKNGKMFSTLDRYANKEFYEEHKTIQFDTIYEKGTYEVMYVFRSHIFNEDEIAFKYYQFIDANSKEEFNSYMEEMDSMSLIDTGVEASYGDQLLTLSTCDYQEANGRFVVVARKVK